MISINLSHNRYIRDYSANIALMRCQAGMAFCPMLPLVGLVANALSFHRYFSIVTQYCRPPTKRCCLRPRLTQPTSGRWNQGRYNVTFYVLLLLNLLAVAVPVFYYLASFNPDCGPFSNGVV